MAQSPREVPTTYPFPISAVYGNGIVTVEQVQHRIDAKYGRKWVIVDFRPPIKEDWYVSQGGLSVIRSLINSTYPALIVEPRPVARRRITIEVGLEPEVLMEGSLYVDRNIECPVDSLLINTYRTHPSDIGEKHYIVRVVGDEIVKVTPP